MKITTETRAIVKAFREAGITHTGTTGSHAGYTDKAGRTFRLVAGKKDQSYGVAKKAWAFIAGDYVKAGIEVGKG
jgi:hypothetical protein